MGLGYGDTALVEVESKAAAKHQPEEKPTAEEGEEKPPAADPKDKLAAAEPKVKPAVVEPKDKPAVVEPKDKPAAAEMVEELKGESTKGKADPGWAEHSGQ